MGSNNEPKIAANDWHREDIIAALHKAGWSIRQLSFYHGYKCGSALKNALDKPWPKGENLIAQAIGIPPNVIWAARFLKRQHKKVAIATRG